MNKFDYLFSYSLLRNLVDFVDDFDFVNYESSNSSKSNENKYPKDSIIDGVEFTVEKYSDYEDLSDKTLMMLMIF